MSNTKTVSSGNDRFFFTLDGIRGVAALLVAQYHAKIFFCEYQQPEEYLAVDVFFVLNGVVLASAYEARLRDGMSLVQFSMRRLARLYPLYIVGSLITVVAYLAGWRTSFSGRDFALLTVLAALFLPNPVVGSPRQMYPLNNPAWSLFY